MNEYIGKSIGASKLTWFPLKTDVENGETTYDDPIKVCRLINVNTDPSLAGAVLDSDDGVEDEVSIMQAIGVSFSGSQVPDRVRAKIFGHTYTDGRVDKKGDQPTIGALAWRTMLSTQGGGKPKYAYHILYKGRLAEFKEVFETMKKDGIAFQTHNDITGTFYARESDGLIRYVMREDSPEFDPEKAKNWFTTPQIPAEETKSPAVNPSGPQSNG